MANWQAASPEFEEIRFGICIYLKRRRGVNLPHHFKRKPIFLSFQLLLKWLFSGKFRGMFSGEENTVSTRLIAF